MNYSEAQHEALRQANATGKIFSVVVKSGADCGLLGNTSDCEVVPFPPWPERVNMANIGPGACLSSSGV